MIRQFKKCREKFASSDYGDLPDEAQGLFRGHENYPSAGDISPGEALRMVAAGLAAAGGTAAAAGGAAAGSVGLGALLSHLKGVLYKRVGRYFGKSPESQKKLYNYGLMGLIPGFIYNKDIREPDNLIDKIKDRTINKSEFYRKK